jgi:hypothetical protein
MSDLVIHALPVAGGILAIAPLPGGQGDFAGDLAHLREWRPAIVLSLTTRIEMVETGSEGLGQMMQESGARWVHLPIADFGVPEPAVAANWPAVSADIRRALSGGGRVLVHCKGGCGRSGMIALRLMIEAGEKPEPALERLRHLRPCAIETEAQMDWALQARRRRRA